jgi:hypothetical protein
VVSIAFILALFESPGKGYSVPEKCKESRKNGVWQAALAKPHFFDLFSVCGRAVWEKGFDINNTPV